MRTVTFAWYDDRALSLGHCLRSCSPASTFNLFLSPSFVILLNYSVKVKTVQTWWYFGSVGGTLKHLNSANAKMGIRKRSLNLNFPDR